MLETICKVIMQHTDLVILGTISVIQVVPIKLNPWTWLLNWIGEKVNGDLRKEIGELRKEQGELKLDFEESKADDMRWNILDFANSCRNGREHTKEEWNHVISQLKTYEVYIQEKHLENGVIEEESKYLRALYQKRLIRNDFL